MDEIRYEALEDIHAEALLPLWSDEEVIRYTNIAEPCSLEEVRKRVDVLKGFAVFVVLRNEMVIGLIGCPCMDAEKAQYGLFYHFRTSVWGQGYATRSTRWLLRFMEQRYPQASLFADVVIDNIASEKILKRVGFEFVSTETLTRKGRSMTVHTYTKPV